LMTAYWSPRAGQILLDEEHMSATTPHKRDFNTVCQNHALFANLTVEKNVAFGLKYQRLSKQEQAQKVGRVLELVRLTGFESRKPSQLSGGQQQRVALARALILNPAVLLLDEPLGALDLKLRQTMQVELKDIQQRVGITFIYVTHDQEEALTMSDRLAVFNHGRIEQVGPPKEVYEEPSTAYVADFLGVSNLMDAAAYGRGDGGAKVKHGDFELVAGQGEEDAQGQVKLCIRPERVELEPSETAGPNRVPGMVERVVYVGSVLHVLVNLAPGGKVQVWLQNEGEGLPWAQGTPVTVHMPREALRVLPEGEVSEEGFAAAAAN